MNEPYLTKRERVHGWGNKELTWTAFLKLRNAAQLASNKFGYPVYLVGSALYKRKPRDIDVSIIMPLEDYEQMFGRLPSSALERAHYGEYLNNVFHKSFEWIKDLHFCIRYDLDIKVCPNTWWTEKQKMLLAEPNKNL